MRINGNLKWEKFIKVAINASSSVYEPIKYCCNSTGETCELTTEFGYCKMTVCTKRHDNFLKDNIDDTSVIIPAEEQEYE